MQDSLNIIIRQERRSLLRKKIYDDSWNVDAFNSKVRKKTFICVGRNKKQGNLNNTKSKEKLFSLKRLFEESFTFILC